MTLFGSGHICAAPSVLALAASKPDGSDRSAGNAALLLHSVVCRHAVPDLQAYLHQFGGVQSPSAAVASNPMLCTWFMFERVSTFLETFLRDELHILGLLVSF